MHETEPAPRLAARLWGALPTVLILAALGGIAVVGHATGWTLPKFSALTGKGQPRPTTGARRTAYPNRSASNADPT